MNEPIEEQKENALTVVESERELTVPQIKAKVNLIHNVLRQVMINGVHYDTIPGTKKPSLLKPGAEKILVTFRIMAEPFAEDLSTSDEIRYRVKMKGTSIATGKVVGWGIGECSTNEDKYKWRRSYNEEEFNATPEDRRRIKWVKDSNGNRFKVSMIRTEPSEHANTVLKMAKKRAYVDLALTTTACSDIFEQDGEEDSVQDAIIKDERPQIQQPVQQLTPTEDNKLRSELMNILIEVFDGQEDKVKEALYNLSTYTGKDGKKVEGVDNPEQLKGRRLEVVLDRARKSHATWKNKTFASKP